MYKGSHFSTSSPTLVIIIFYNSYPNGHERFAGLFVLQITSNDSQVLIEYLGAPHSTSSLFFLYYFILSHSEIQLPLFCSLHPDKNSCLQFTPIGLTFHYQKELMSYINLGYLYAFSPQMTYKNIEN